MKKIFIVIAVVSIIAISIVLLFVFPLHPIPDGLPNDYYERFDVLLDNNIKLYLYSDEIDFNDDIQYHTISDIDEVPISSTLKTFIIVDMNKYNNDSDFASELEIQKYYEDYRVGIVFINYMSSHSELLTDFIESSDFESDLILYGYDKYNVATKGSVTDEFPSHQMMMYAIIDQIAYLIE